MEKQEKRDKNEKLAVGDNTPFFERYFTLCKKYAERRELQDLFRKDRIREDDLVKARARLTELARELEHEEDIFWSAPPDAQAELFRDYAARFALNHFAQRVVLLILYRELSGEENSELTPLQFIETLDFTGTLTLRIQLLRQFSPDSTLLKRKVLRFERERFRHGGGLTLNPKHLELLARLLNGEEVDWSVYETVAAPAQEEAGEDEEEMPEHVGCVRAPSVTLDDVVLAPAVRERLEFFLDQHRDGTLDKLGVTKHIRFSRGMTLLFFGPPGTGKSMLAEAVAARLGREVLHVEVPKIMSRWVGETDKQIVRAFAAAKARNLVLLFDEADSLLVRRDMLFQDHDIRFVNDMLSAIEHYEGTVVLTTNMDALLDAAVERRVDMRIKFDPPTAEQREIIWQKHIRMDIPLADDINCAHLARAYEFTGGYVRNAVLNAVRKMIAGKRDTLTMADLEFGAAMERDGMFVKENRHVRVAGFAIPPAAAPGTATAARKS